MAGEKKDEILNNKSFIHLKSYKFMSTIKWDIHWDIHTTEDDFSNVYCS